MKFASRTIASLGLFVFTTTCAQPKAGIGKPLYLSSGNYAQLSTDYSIPGYANYKRTQTAINGCYIIVKSTYESGNAGYFAYIC